MQASNPITTFWQLFGRRRAALAQIDSADDPVYDELLEQLQQIDEGLFFELSAQPGDCELIITAEGDSDLFELVDSIVDAAAPAEGWTFIALKPKRGFAATVQWDGYAIDIAEVRIQFTDVASLETATGKNIALTDLEQFMEWRSKQLGQ